MSFLCCGIKYSKSDIETFQSIETDLIRDFTKKKIGKSKVVKQVVETLLCKKCYYIKVHNKFFGRAANGKLKILEVEKLQDNIHTGKTDPKTGEEIILNAATDFLMQTEKIRIRQPQKEPVKRIPFAKNIDLCYGKILDSYTQRARYINEQDWGHNSEKIHSECKIEQMKQTEKIA